MGYTLTENPEPKNSLTKIGSKLNFCLVFYLFIIKERMKRKLLFINNGGSKKAINCSFQTVGHSPSVAAFPSTRLLVIHLLVQLSRPPDWGSFIFFFWSFPVHQTVGHSLSVAAFPPFRLLVIHLLLKLSRPSDCWSFTFCCSFPAL